MRPSLPVKSTLSVCRGALGALLLAGVVSLVGARAAAETRPQTGVDDGRTALLQSAGLAAGTAASSNSSCEWVEGFHRTEAYTFNNRVYTSLVFDDGTGPALFVGGTFTEVSGITANRIAKWDGHRWSQLGSGLNGAVLALAVFDDGSGPALYAGGQFTMAGEVNANRLARWDGTEWSALPSELDGSVLALTVHDDGSGAELYAGGYFTMAGGISVNYIAKWNGFEWSALEGGGTGDPIHALTVFDDGNGPALYAGGAFASAGGVSASRIAKWDGTSWSALGTGMSNWPSIYVNVYSLMVFDDGSGEALYAGGRFSSAGGVSAQHIAKWDGTAWSALGTGFPYWVRTMVAFDDGNGPALHVGGRTISSNDVGDIGKWSGSEWISLGTGVDGPVLTLTVLEELDGPALFAGGSFNDAGGVPFTNRAATWNGATWSSTIPKGNGVNDQVLALTTFDDGQGSALYAGGRFTLAGDVSASRIAKWNGTEWSALGSGITGGSNTGVFALTVFDGGAGAALYAGGEFTSVGGVSANRVARWNGTNWSAMGVGLAGTVLALATYDSGGGPSLYAGGAFEGCVRKWNGGGWSYLSTQMSGTVRALAVYDDGNGPALYAGGFFTLPGHTGTFHIAKWNGSGWSPVGQGVNSSVYALAVFDDGYGPALYAGGAFTVAGGSNAYFIAKWDGSTWAPLGFGLGETVRVLGTFNDGNGPALYAGGLFTTAGGTSANYLAKWDGDGWSALNMGTDHFVYALAEFDDGLGRTLYAGGPSFASDGSHPSSGEQLSSRLAAWRCPPGCSSDPESCDCGGDPPQAEAGGVSKNRFISFVPGNAGEQMAIRVRLTNPPAAFASFTDEIRWVGPATQFEETAFAAGLQCAPHCAYWGPFDLLHVYGADIVPGAEYEVQLVNCVCDPEDESNYSERLVIATTKWGDIVAPFHGDGSSVQPDIGDISALASKFSSAPGAVAKARAKLQPSLLNPTAPVDVSDIAHCVSAFNGGQYPFNGPCACPSAVSCGQSCTVNGDCGGGVCVNNQCLDACGRCTP